MLVDTKLLSLLALYVTGSGALNYQERYGDYLVLGNRSLRVATGGAGQSGLLKAWAIPFIDDCVSKGVLPFYVDWYLGDTTQSLSYLKDGYVDAAITYNDLAEQHALATGSAIKRVYGFRDHFYLVGPPSDPAELASATSILDAFNRIVEGGNRDLITTPKDGILTRFLSRFDTSATNIKESLLFATIGQIPWALAYSKWYHQYPQFPLQALAAAASLKEYTLTDRGTWLSSPSDVTSTLQIYERGDQNDPDQLLLNPARVLLGAKAAEMDIGEKFLAWVIDDQGGQEVIRNFKKNGEVLYDTAPLNTTSEPFCDCKPQQVLQHSNTRLDRTPESFGLVRYLFGVKQYEFFSRFGRRNVQERRL